MRINVGGARIDRYDFDQVVERIVAHVRSGGAPEYVVTPNAQHVLTLRDDDAFRSIYEGAYLVVPDGVSLLYAARFLGTPLCGRVNGTDLLEKLCEIAAENDLEVFFLGGRPGAADRASQTLRARHPGLRVAGTHCPPYGFESMSSELALINSKIKAASPQLLFVGLGSPKQEKWIHANYRDLGVPISIGIGVSFELVSGMVRRAPLWMQQAGLEWLFRLAVEPRRLWQRYMIGNPRFVWLILLQRLRPSRLR